MLGIIFGAMVVMLILTVPIGVMLLVVSLIPSLISPGFSASIPFVLRNVVGGLNSTPLLAIPLFILGGIIMAQSGIAEKLFDVFAYLIGNKTGGMPCASIITCLFYGAISGSAPATTAAVGTMTIPILDDLGYDHTFSASTVAVAGGLGVIIPPSVPFIVYSMASGASVGDMFLAGIIPGFLIAACLMIYAIFYCKTKGENKQLIHQRVSELRAKGFWGVLKSSFWARWYRYPYRGSPNRNLLCYRSRSFCLSDLKTERPASFVRGSCENYSSDASGIGHGCCFFQNSFFATGFGCGTFPCGRTGP